MSPAPRRRTRREEVPASKLRKGDVIAPYGHDPHNPNRRATVTHSEPFRLSLDPNRDTGGRAVSFRWPDDFTVNARLRGQGDGRVWPNDHLVTRYVPV